MALFLLVNLLNNIILNVIYIAIFIIIKNYINSVKIT